MNETVDTPVDRFRAAMVSALERHERELRRIRRFERMMNWILIGCVVVFFAAMFWPLLRELFR